MSQNKPLLCGSCGKEIDIEISLKRALDEYFGQEPTQIPLCKECVLLVSGYQKDQSP